MGNELDRCQDTGSSSFLLDQLMSPWTVHFIPRYLPPSVKWVCKYWHTCLTRTFWNHFAYVFIFTEHLHNHDLTFSYAHSFNKYHWECVTCLSFCQILAIQMALLSGNCYSDGGHRKVNKQLKHNVIDIIRGISVECFEILTMACETNREAVIIRFTDEETEIQQIQWLV